MWQRGLSWGCHTKYKWMCGMDYEIWKGEKFKEWKSISNPCIWNFINLLILCSQLDPK